MRTRILGLATALLLLVGCSSFVPDAALPDTTAYAYTAYDSTGAALVRGTLRLSFREAGDEACTRACTRYVLGGTWSLEHVGTARRRIARHTGEGRLRGSVRSDGHVWIDLNPEWEDANVTLTGTFENEDRTRLRGQWLYMSWAPMGGGRFEAVR